MENNFAKMVVSPQDTQDVIRIANNGAFELTRIWVGYRRGFVDVCCEGSEKYAELFVKAPDNLDKIELLMGLLTRCAPYLKELDSENYGDESVGIFEDTELTDLYRSVKMEIEGITEQDIAETAPDEPVFK